MINARPILTCAVLLVGLGGAAPAGVSTDGEFLALGHSLEWTPRCERLRPRRPIPGQPVDAEALRRDVGAWGECVDRQANADAAAAAEAIRLGREAALKDMLGQLD